MFEKIKKEQKSMSIETNIERTLEDYIVEKLKVYMDDFEEVLENARKISEDNGRCSFKITRDLPLYPKLNGNINLLDTRMLTELSWYTAGGISRLVISSSRKSRRKEYEFNIEIRIYNNSVIQVEGLSFTKSPSNMNGISKVEEELIKAIDDILS